MSLPDLDRTRRFRLYVEKRGGGSVNDPLSRLWKKRREAGRGVVVRLIEEVENERNYFGLVEAGVSAGVGLAGAAASAGLTASLGGSDGRPTLDEGRGGATVSPVTLPPRGPLIRPPVVGAADSFGTIDPPGITPCPVP